MNNSNNLDSVLNRYNTAIKTLKKSSVFTNDEFNTMGLLFEKSFPDILKIIQDNKIRLFNQAITQNLEHNINSVAKNEAKTKTLCKYDNPLLLPENKAFL